MTIQLRRDTAANLASKVLAQGEPAYTTDGSGLKIGDGTTAFSSLTEIGAGGGGGGGGGDITAVTAGTGLSGGGVTGGVTLNVDTSVLTTGNLTARTGLILTGKTLDVDTNVLTTGNLNTRLTAGSGVTLTYVGGTNELEIHSNLVSNTGLAGGGSGVTNIVFLSSAAYSAIGSKHATTLYFIT